jgi:hypothetical protein
MTRRAVRHSASEERCALSGCGLPLNGVSYLTITWRDGLGSCLGFCSDAHLDIALSWLREIAPDGEEPERSAPIRHAQE